MWKRTSHHQSYGTELVREVGAAEKLDKVWEMAVAEGTLVGDANVWHSAEARIRRGGLRWHSQELPWSCMIKTASSEAGGGGGETGQECRRATRGNCDHSAEGAGDVWVCGSVFGSRKKHFVGGRTGCSLKVLDNDGRPLGLLSLSSLMIAPSQLGLSMHKRDSSFS